MCEKDVCGEEGCPDARKFMPPATTMVEIYDYDGDDYDYYYYYHCPNNPTHEWQFDDKFIDPELEVSEDKQTVTNTE